MLAHAILRLVVAHERYTISPKCYMPTVSILLFGRHRKWRVLDIKGRAAWEERRLVITLFAIGPAFQATGEEMHDDCAQITCEQDGTYCTAAGTMITLAFLFWRRRCLDTCRTSAYLHRLHPRPPSHSAVSSCVSA